MRTADTQAARTRTAVVTGASSGIGAATARALAREGFEVVLTARRADRLEAVAKEIRNDGGTVQVFPLDVTDREAVLAFAAQFPACDVLVNNAGGAYGTEHIENADPGDWRSMYEVNVVGALHMTQALLPALKASGDGVVVVISSTASFTCYEGGADTAPPSTAPTYWPRLCVWRCAGRRCGWSRSLLGWSTPRSSP